MQEKLDAYREAAQRGASWLLAQQNPDGSFIRPDLQADVYHKAVLALMLSGHVAASNRLLTWIKAYDLQPDGRLRRFDEGLGLYKTSWICQGAHRMGRFDISVPVMDFIQRCQAPCGGFFQSPELTEYVEPVSSSWAGVAAIYLGRMEAARRCAGCLEQMLAQQPDPRRFYFHMSPEGQLRTHEGAPFVDATQPQQAYYCPGIAALFAMRLYMATGEDRALRLARGMVDFQLTCAEDAFAYITSGKSGVATALLYAATGAQDALDATLSVADYMTAKQSPEGWWCNPHADNMVIRLDHTAEMVIWLTEIVATLAAT